MPGIPIKYILIGAFFLAVGLTVYLGYSHYKNLLAENATLRENAVKLSAAIETQKQTIELAKENAREWKAKFSEWQDTLTNLVDVNQRATTELNRLNNIFAKHDLERLAAAKPVLIERRINRGTVDAFRVLEHATAGGDVRPDPTGTSAGTSDDTEPLAGKVEAGRVESSDKGNSAR